MNNAELTKELEVLKGRLKTLEERFSFDGGNFEELIRDTIFFDNNPTGALTSTTVVTGVNFGAQTTTTASLQTGTPAKFLKLYYRGAVYQLPVYAI